MAAAMRWLCLAAGVMAEISFDLIKTQAECNTENVDLGVQPGPRACAEACAAQPSCSFFVSGTGAQVGHCHQELANSSDCASGYLIDETMDFYQLHRNGVTGCTDNRASNYDAAATVDNGSCEGADTCASRSEDGKCANCVEQGMCTSGNEGYRNAEFDTIYASRVEAGSIAIDGDLRDWADHLGGPRCYDNVAFATETGEVVRFENFGSGGMWYGPNDFGVRFMLSWDDEFLYLAAEVSDDILQVGQTCFTNGLQAAFEVGGPESPDGAGMLQRQRSKELDISRLNLLNVGLQPEQVSSTGAACSSDRPDPNGCCVHYELSQSEGGFAQSTKAAVLRNPNSKKTNFEVAFAITDLMGSEHRWRWGEGLAFGFSFLVNDGDETTAQQGWAGYYPHSIVHGYNAGQKQPSKVGVLQLAGPDGSDCGNCNWWIFFGTFILAPMLAGAAFLGRYAYRRRVGVAGSGPRAANPLARADQMGTTPALTVVTPPMSSTA